MKGNKFNTYKYPSTEGSTATIIVSNNYGSHITPPIFGQILSIVVNPPVKKITSTLGVGGLNLNLDLSS